MIDPAERQRLTHNAARCAQDIIYIKIHAIAALGIPSLTDNARSCFEQIKDRSDQALRFFEDLQFGDGFSTAAEVQRLWTSALPYCHELKVGAPPLGVSDETLAQIERLKSG